MCIIFKYAIRPGKKNFGSDQLGQLIFENWSGGPVTFFFWNHNLNFPNLMNINMQRLMLMQRWQPGGVSTGCQVLGRGLLHKAPGK